MSNEVVQPEVISISTSEMEAFIAMHDSRGDWVGRLSSENSFVFETSSLPEGVEIGYEVGVDWFTTSVHVGFRETLSNFLYPGEDVDGDRSIYVPLIVPEDKGGGLEWIELSHINDNNLYTMKKDKGLNNTRTPVAYLDQDGHLLAANTGFGAFVDLDNDEIIGAIADQALVCEEIPLENIGGKSQIKLKLGPEKLSVKSHIYPNPDNSNQIKLEILEGQNKSVIEIVKMWDRMFGDSVMGIGLIVGGEVLDLSRSLCEAVNVKDVSELKNIKMVDILTPESYEKVMPHIIDIMRDGGRGVVPIMSLDIVGIQQEGETGEQKITQMLAGINKFENGEIVLFAVDVSGYEKLLQILGYQEESMQMIRHEMKTPLSAMSLYVDLLHRTGNYEKYGPLIAERTKYLEELITALSSAESKKDWFDIINLITVIVEDSRLGYQGEGHIKKSGIREVPWVLSSENNIQLTLNMEGIVNPMYLGIQGMIGPAVSTIVNNALKILDRSIDKKYNENNPRSVEVDLCIEDGNVKILIKDNGPGISEEDLMIIFKANTQTNFSDLLGLGGTGNGLHYANRFISINGGEIDVESKVGVGTAFTITLPIVGEP